MAGEVRCCRLCLLEKNVLFPFFLALLRDYPVPKNSSSSNNNTRRANTYYGGECVLCSRVADGSAGRQELGELSPNSGKSSLFWDQETDCGAEQRGGSRAIFPFPRPPLPPAPGSGDLPTQGYLENQSSWTSGSRQSFRSSSLLLLLGLVTLVPNA